MVRASFIAAIAGLAVSFAPAQFLSGPLPANQVAALGGGEIWLEATVTPGGSVADVATLRATPPFTNAVQTAITAWRFTPAKKTLSYLSEASRQIVNPEIPVSSKVLVAALFRPPTINTPTFGDVPKDVAPPSDEIPVPVATTTPPYPPQALFDGVVLVEVQVSIAGAVNEARVVRSAYPFDQAALEAAWHWRFRPARIDGTPHEAYAYIIFGFRQPITSK